MCGLIGYIGYRDAQPILLDSLKRLEYRGYDSCGIAIPDGDIAVYKQVGRVVALEQNMPRIRGRSGIGHTRWATHGGVTQVNAHPHLDCSGRIAVVHNGVIENFQRLRQELTEQGHHFRSETDTEVIPHLIEKYYNGNLEQAVARALDDVVGAYAVIVLAADHRELIGARKESPLVVGVGDRENFLSSDVAAILGYTERVIYLEDDDLAIMSGGEISVTSQGQRVARKEHKILWSPNEAQKAGYEHFTLKEIHEQPRAISDTYEGHISLLEATVNWPADMEQGVANVLLVACGTSYYAALIGEYLLSELCHSSVRVKVASEFNHSKMMLDKTWVIGITQSGETADTLRSLKIASEMGCRTLAITNVEGSSATRIADHVFYIRAGLEKGVAATKSFLAQLTALYLLALSHTTTDIKTYESLLEELGLVPMKVQEVLDRESQIAQYAKRLARYENAFFVGRGLNYPVAMEGALKLKEISYIHAEAYPAGELKHGPFALLNSKVPVIAIATRDDTYEAMLVSIKEIKARGPWVIALAEDRDQNIEQFVDDVIRVPQIAPLFSPFLNSVVLQLLAYYTAKERGCPIDFPANLAKSVTVP